jgi:hypothetical protein
MRRHRYFEHGEYILVDKGLFYSSWMYYADRGNETGYPSTPFTVRPFDEPEISAASDTEEERMRTLNLRLSSVRIVIEHTFGLLKGRFPSLRGMGPHNNIQDIYRTIEALMILHKIEIDVRDRPDVSWRIDESPDDHAEIGNPEREIQVADVVGDAQVPAYETDGYLREQGKIKGWHYLTDCFN